MRWTLLIFVEKRSQTELGKSIDGLTFTAKVLSSDRSSRCEGAAADMDFTINVMRVMADLLVQALAL